MDQIHTTKPPIDKIQKYGAENFYCTAKDDLEKIEFCLENTVRVFDELSYTLIECLNCVVLLLKDSTYQLWNTMITVVSRDCVNWEFFQTGFRKKYISQRFLDKKRKEFLELKQGRVTVAEYEREFVRLRKYAHECVPTEVAIYTRFEDSLNKDIKLLVGILELKKFLVLVDRAHKAEEVSKAKGKAYSKARDTGK